MPFEIVGAPTEYEHALREILDANPGTLVERYRFEPLGRGLVLWFDDPRTARQAWEGRTIAAALLARARARGFAPRLSMTRFGEEDRDYLAQAPTSGLLRHASVAHEQALLADVRRTAERSCAQVEGLDVVRLPAVAWALVLHVDEPHEFLRHRLRARRQTTSRFATITRSRRS